MIRSDVDLLPPSQWAWSGIPSAGCIVIRHFKAPYGRCRYIGVSIATGKGWAYSESPIAEHGVPADMVAAFERIVAAGEHPRYCRRTIQ
jgi:hypothetical protein